ncbi:MAG: hypothetical protein FWF45_03635 [Coriobacteriia bacterium]|nr:hypothetical protein [Coriobacteriia bacterium]
MKNVRSKIAKIGIPIGVCLVLLAVSSAVFLHWNSSTKTARVKTVQPQNVVHVIELKIPFGLDTSNPGGPMIPADAPPPMTTQQISSYYGVNIVPSYIPKGLSEAKEAPGVWTDTGSIDSSYSKMLLVAVSKQRLSYFQAGDVVSHMYNPTKNNESAADLNQYNDVSNYKPDAVSKINGVDMVIGHYTDEANDLLGMMMGHYSDLFCAQFFYKNTGFWIYSQNISQNDFIKTVASVIK